MDIIVVSEPVVEKPPEVAEVANTHRRPDPIPAAIEQERLARIAQAAATSARISSLEDALVEASIRAAAQLEAMENLRRRRRIWLSVILLLITGGALWQVALKNPDVRGPATTGSAQADSSPAESRPAATGKNSAAVDSALRRFARLPSSKSEPDRRPLPQPPSELARAADSLGAALELHPEQAWPQIIDRVRENSGNSVCPFLWVDGALAFILPDAPHGISSMPAAMLRCAEAVAKEP